MAKKKDIVQIKNPDTGRYTKIDRGTGAILSHKKTDGKYKGIPVVAEGTIKIEGEAESNCGGRPAKYETVAEMQRIIDLYFLACKVHQKDDIDYLEGLSTDDLLVVNDIDDTVPTVSGLAYTLGMSTEALRNYEEKDGFLVTVKRAKQRIEMSLEQRLAGNAVTGAIFNLKNNFGWKDKKETNLNGKLVLHDMSEEELDGEIARLARELAE